MLFTAFIKVMAITTVSLSKSKHYFSPALAHALNNLELGLRAAEGKTHTTPTPPSTISRNRARTADPVCLHECTLVCVHAHVCRNLECELKCAFYQASKLQQPKDGRAGTHRGHTVTGPEYEFASLHSEQRMS